MPIEELVEGYKGFCKQFFEEDESLYRKLVRHGQNPRAAVVACADSRVSPTALLQARPGDLFVIRNVGNLIQPPGSAAGTSTLSGLEYAVLRLEVAHIIIIGHSHCGGIQALIDGPTKVGPHFPHVASWVSSFGSVRRQVLKQCADASEEETARALEKAAARASLAHLAAYPWIQERVAEGRLSLHAWYFDLENGTLSAFDQEKGDYVTLVARDGPTD